LRIKSFFFKLNIHINIQAIHIHDVQQITMDEDGQRAPGRSCLRAEADYGLHKNLSVSFDLDKITVVTFQINEGNKVRNIFIIASITFLNSNSIQMSIQTKEVNTMGSVVQSIRTQRYLVNDIIFYVQLLTKSTALE
jgi:hypothetical protein